MGLVSFRSAVSGDQVKKGGRPGCSDPGRTRVSHHPNPKVKQERCMLHVSAQANSKQRENKMADCRLESVKLNSALSHQRPSQKTIASAVHHSCFTHYRCACVYKCVYTSALSQTFSMSRQSAYRTEPLPHNLE